MKRNFKILIILMLAVAIFSGCKKEGSSSKLVNENTNNTSNTSNINNADKKKSPEKDSNKTGSKDKKVLRPVKGAKIGSMSSYVEDREIWNDFMDEKYIESAKRDNFGIHLPRILLDSKDAKAANAEIDEMVENIKNIYETHKDDSESADLGIYLSFSTYQDENILSVMIESYDYWQDDPADYIAYNFSLPDGKFIDDYKLMSNFGVDADDLLGIVEDSLRERQDLTTGLYYSDVLDNTFIYNPSNYTGMVLNTLWDKFRSIDHQIYIDEVGKPNFLFSQYDLGNMGFYPVTLNLKSNNFNKNPISDEYLRMARKLGIDPTDKKYKAFIIYLGSVYDEDSLKRTLEKLYPWSSLFLDYEDPNMLISMKESKGGDMPFLNGAECYLIIPKYRNASVSLKELEISKDGKLKEVDNYLLDNNACAGTTFICQNISEIAPNGKITIRYRDDVLEFSPSISLKDGSLILPKGVFNAEDILDWNSLVEEDLYSYTMFERINFILGVG